MAPSQDSQGRTAIARDAFGVKRRGPEAVARAQRARLASLVELARTRSPFYRRLYSGLPARVEDPLELPITTKAELMEGFDGWTTDRNVTRERVDDFMADSDRGGQTFLGRYLVATTSGTTGVPANLVTDRRAFAVADALRLRALASWLGVADVAKILRARGRMANLAAVGGHFTTVGLASRGRVRRRTMRLFSVFAPVSELVTELNRWRPSILSGYASVIRLLAEEQEAGRLDIDPVLIASSAEGLSPAEADSVAGAFDAKHRSTYAAAECPFIGHSCELGWIHVNSDWVLLEPVDAERRPVPPGELSQGALLTNLANRVQPVIRYALNDRLLMRPDPCPCGSPLPAVQVQGRAADLLELGPPGDSVLVAALPVTVILMGIPGIDQFQIVQTDPATLRVRMVISDRADPEGIWRAAIEGLRSFLDARGLTVVEVERASEPPARSEGGKLRKIVPLSSGAEATA